MAKPICLITVDASVLTTIGVKVDPWELCSKLSDSYRDSMPDYHMFVIPNHITFEPIPPIHIQVFHEKDFTEIQYNELKEIIEKSINQVNGKQL